jgi:hypothetical protein
MAFSDLKGADVMVHRVAAGMALVLALAVPRGLPGQSAPTAAATWDAAYTEITGMLPSSGRGASVSGLVLQRETGQFTLSSGTMVLLTPIRGRVMGATFRGTGTFTFAPTTEMERQQLSRNHKGTTLTVPFTEAVFLFSDTTLAELERELRFEPGVATGTASNRLSQALDYLGDDQDHSIEPDVMIELLNAAPGGMFYAHLIPTSGSPIMFLVTPREGEGVELREREGAGLASGGYSTTTVKERGTATAAGPAGDRVGDALIRHYALDVSLPSTGFDDIGFSASARIFISGEAPIGPWVAFSFFGKFTVDSAQWADGTPAVVEKKKDSPYLWVRLPKVVPVGESVQLVVWYHGDLIDRLFDFFVIKGSTAWYPRPLSGRSLATFEMIYHYPSKYLFASVGELMDSTTTGQITTSRWVTARPIRNASFNIGMFKAYTPVEPGAPPVTVLVSESGHRAIGSKAYSADEASLDIARSMKLFTTMFGPPPADQFYATEIPAGHGEAFPGLIHLSMATFDITGTQGHNEVFRAHEVAHQWWGIGVDFATYRDQWLSEGFSEFAALWYLQTVRGDGKQYFAMLDEWKADLLVRGADAAPIGLGMRTADEDNPGDYNLIVYEKGAWVLHMLRAMMVDLKTMNEDRFAGMMKDFYQTYRGKRASTADFQRMVEQHTGQDMGWFFSQWVYRSAIPTYRVAYQFVDAPDGKYVVKVRVRQLDVPEDFQMYVPIGIELGKDQWVRVRKKVTGPLTEFELGPLPSKPKSVKFNDLDGVLADVKMEGWGA